MRRSRGRGGGPLPSDSAAPVCFGHVQCFVCADTIIIIYRGRGVAGVRLGEEIVGSGAIKEAGREGGERASEQEGKKQMEERVWLAGGEK